jgi:hypothetical protein
VSALVRLMENGPGVSPTLNPEMAEMAFLVWVLQRARGDAPLWIADYRLVEGDAIAAADRRFLRRILGATSASYANHCASPRNGLRDGVALLECRSLFARKSGRFLFSIKPSFTTRESI